jgi:hypothetical protein
MIDVTISFHLSSYRASKTYAARLVFMQDLKPAAVDKNQTKFGIFKRKRQS